MKHLSPLGWESCSDYLNALITAERSERRERTSLAEWSARLGYRSPRSLAMVLKGQRLPSAQMLMRLAQLMKLSDREYRWLVSTTELQRAGKKRGDKVEATVADLERLRGAHSRLRHLPADQFRVVAEWQHFAIKQLISTPDFREDAAWIKRRLRGKLTATEVRASIQRLLSLGFIARGEDGSLRESEVHVRTKTDVASQAAKLHHKQMMRRAEEALTEQAVEAREFDSKTLRVDPQHIDEAKRFLRGMRDEFIERFSSQDAGEVFQLNMQFFSHTDDGGR